MNGRDLLYYIMEDISGIMSILLQAVYLYPGNSFDYTRSISYGVDLNTKSRFKRNTKSRFSTMSRIKIRRDDLTPRVDLTRRVD